MIPGRAGTMTHDYRRNGTTDLFAAMNLATGEVLHDTCARHRGRDVSAFFKLIDRHVPIVESMSEIFSSTFGSTRRSITVKRRSIAYLLKSANSSITRVENFKASKCGTGSGEATGACAGTHIKSRDGE